MLQNILIKPASGLCNMKCEYCFYCDEAEKRKTESFGMMDPKTIENIIKKVLRQGRGEICFAFQGGEPTLRGLDFFRQVIQLEKSYNIHQCTIRNSLQTNGFALDRQWCEFFREHNFLIGVSLDGTELLHNRYRRQKNGADTYQNVRRSISLLQEYGVEYNILTVVTKEIAENIKDIYLEYKRNRWMYQQYIACLDPIGEQKGQKRYSLTPECYGKFLTDLFRAWYKDWKRNKAPYIRQFENYVGILMGYPPESCEQRGTCSVQCVTEADGSVYPCDFYVMDAYCLGNFNTDQIRDFFSHTTAKTFLEESEKISDRCKRCEYYALCRAGCRRNRVQEAESETYYNYFCEGYRYFFSQCYPELSEIARYVTTSNR